jgi:hypothetical protein
LTPPSPDLVTKYSGIVFEFNDVLMWDAKYLRGVRGDLKAANNFDPGWFGASSM